MHCATARMDSQLASMHVRNIESASTALASEQSLQVVLTAGYQHPILRCRRLCGGI